MGILGPARELQQTEVWRAGCRASAAPFPIVTACVKHHAQSMENAPARMGSATKGRPNCRGLFQRGNEPTCRKTMTAIRLFGIIAGVAVLSCQTNFRRLHREGRAVVFFFFLWGCEAGILQENRTAGMIRL